MKRQSATSRPILQIVRNWCLIEPLRKLFSILLLAVFALPLVSPLFALGTAAEAGMQACCRRNGKHHCIMSKAEREKASPRDLQISGPTEKCPYCPQAIANVHLSLLANLSRVKDMAPLTGHPAGIAQTESRRRSSQDRSRQKRGPPPAILG
jgi:hypothetical protein